MALQHLRSSTANKRPLPGSMSDGQLAVNTEATSPGLFFKNASGSLVKVGPVHVGTTAPNVSPAAGGETGNTVGEQWLDTTGGTYVFKVWDGSAWRSETGTFVDVNGDTMTGALGIIAGSAGSPGLFVSGDTNTGIYSPGADQLALTTGGTSRMTVNASGNVAVGTSVLYVDASNARVGIGTTSPAKDLDILKASEATATINTGTVALDLSASNDKGGSIGTSTPHALSFKFYDITKIRLDTSGNVLYGGSSSITIGGSAPAYQQEGIDGPGSSYSLLRHSNTAGSPPILKFARSGGTALSSVTAVAANYSLGQLAFYGANGTDYSNAAGAITCLVDGEPFTAGDTTDLPGRIVFATTADGASTVTERFRITSEGARAYNQATPISKNAAAVLTIDELLNGIINYTGAAATLTLPTGTLSEGGFNSPYTNITIEWSVINTGSGTCTIGAGTAHTIAGAATIAAGASGRFASRRTAANTFISYRLS